jgi:uncharacterized membrane protein (DUF106 family)
MMLEMETEITMESLLIVGLVVSLIGGVILTLIRGILVDRTRAKNKQLIMDHYGGLSGWPTEESGPPSEPGDRG